MMSELLMIYLGHLKHDVERADSGSKDQGGKLSGGVSNELSH
jgi:hypothetical protein